jgi:GT2 family glycosyltransferase
MTASVLYVVPTFNRAANLPVTIGAIAAQRWPDACKSILVVDNASTDNTAEILADLASRLPFPLEHLRKKPEGPTVARNIGLSRGRDRYVALVDSDVELDPGWTEATVGAMDADPALAQVGGKLVFGHNPGVLNSYGGVLGRFGLAWDRAEGEPAASCAAPMDTLWINTSAVLLRPEPVLDVGGFDAGFFYAYEEPDLGLRLAIAGWRSRVIPTAVALHHVDTLVVESHPDFVFHYCKNRLRMGIKSLAFPRLVPFLMVSAAYGLLDSLLHRPRGARLRALWWNVTHWGETWRLRQTAQARRTVPDRQALAAVDRRCFPPQRLRAMRRRAVAGGSYGTGHDDRVEVAPGS